MKNQQPRQNTDRLVAVVVTYNRLHQLKQTLDALLASPPTDLHAVVVVDNACTDGTAEWLATISDPRLHVERTTVNTGGAGGFETGMRIATSTYDPDWFVLMDDDGRPTADAIATFHSKDRSGYEAIAAAVYTPSGAICDINRPSRNPFWNIRAFFRTLLGGGREGFHMGPDDFNSDRIVDIDGASFVGLFVSRAAVDRIGYPEGRLFIYGDDVLYTLKLRKAGGRIAFDPGIRFEHDYLSILEGEKRFRPLWKTYYHHRNLLMVYRVAAGPWFLPVLFVVVPKWALKLRHHSGERWQFWKLQRCAIWHGLLRKTDTPHSTIVSWSENPPSD